MTRGKRRTRTGMHPQMPSQLRRQQPTHPPHLLHRPPSLSPHRQQHVRRHQPHVHQRQRGHHGGDAERGLDALGRVQAVPAERYRPAGLVRGAGAAGDKRGGHHRQRVRAGRTDFRCVGRPAALPAVLPVPAGGVDSAAVRTLRISGLHLPDVGQHAASSTVRLHASRAAVVARDHTDWPHTGQSPPHSTRSTPLHTRAVRSHHRKPHAHITVYPLSFLDGRTAQGRTRRPPISSCPA